MQKGIMIWLVDDSKSVLSLMTEMLTKAGYSVKSFLTAESALEKFYENRPHVIISDIMMPGMDGVTFLEKIFEVDREMPVILITSNPKMDFALQAIRNHAFDFILKPVDEDSLLMSVRRAVEFRELLEEQRATMKMMEEANHRNTFKLKNAFKELKDTTLETILVLTKAAEYRDQETAEHIRRIGFYSHMISIEMGLDESFAETILYASPMHDIGKIGISDGILLKKGSLSKEESESMQLHTVIGARILSEGKSKILEMAKDIALYHHEWWDRSGYPMGLKGDEIPMAARITLITDVYDALRSKRSYKKSFSHDEAFKIITQGTGRTMPSHFDPDVLSAFCEIEEVFDDIFSGNNSKQAENTTANASMLGL